MGRNGRDAGHGGKPIIIHVTNGGEAPGVQAEREGRGVHPPAGVGKEEESRKGEAGPARQGGEGAPEETPPHEVLQVRDGDDLNRPGFSRDFVPWVQP